MSILVWNEDYSVGNEEMDNHHKKLFSLMDQLSALLCKDDAEEELKAIIKELIAYTDFHFKAEEQLMEASNYPLLADHKAKHDDLIKQLTAITTKKSSSIYDVLDDTFLLVNQWLVHHIMNEDKQYEDKL